MPLRINDDFPHDDDERKLRKKMARNGHYQKVRRPTGLEVYNDAARILDELLEARLDDDFRGARRQRRNKTDPRAERVSIDTDEKPNVARSKTMPSKYRESKDASARATSKAKVEDDGSISSMDTEDEGSQTTDKRRKKSLFKRTTERLMQTFQRDKKVRKDREKLEMPESPSKKRKLKSKKKSKGGVVSQSNRHISAHVHEDRSLDYDEELDIKDKKGSTHTELHTHKDRIGSISSLLRPFKKTKKEPSPSILQPPVSSDGDYECEYGMADDFGAHGSSLPTPSRSQSPPPPLLIAQSGKPRVSQRSGPLPPPPLFRNGSPAHRVPDLESRSKSSSPVTDRDSAKHSPHGGAKGVGLPSSSSTTFPISDHSWGSGSIAPGVLSSVLDSPGDDIEFMDTDVPGDRSIQGSRGPEGGSLSLVGTGPPKIHDSIGLMNFKWLKDADSANKLDMEIDERTVSTRREDGAIETTTTITATRTVVMPDLREEDEYGEEGAEAPRENGENGQNKDEIYGKIAQRLIEMADSYNASVSDTEGQGAAAAESTPLTELEQKIIQCLRSGGDKHNPQFEKKMDEMKTEAQQDAYGRFKNTVQHSMGADMSWDLLALLFYTTKGVVSAVGKGTQTATQAKEFTLQYISDTYANWIVEQGGFDSMLSSGESDYDVD